jgi:hypothetical protein
MVQRIKRKVRSADSFGASVPHGTDATKGKYGGVTRRAVGRRMIGADEVRLLSPHHHLLKLEQEQEKWERGEPTDNAILRGQRQKGPRVGSLGGGGGGLCLPDT